MKWLDCRLISPDGSRERGGAKCAAFSLVEILVVIAIMVVLLAIAVPASSSLLGGMNMGRSAGIIADELNFARQTALSRNRDVEVRFYKVASKVGGGEGRFRAVQSFLIEGLDPAGWKPMSRVKVLPEPIMISDDAAYSSLLKPPSGSGGITQGNENLPGHGNSDYVSFLFRANGGTSLKPVTEKWFMTLLSEKSADQSGLPANYFTVQVDPVTGRTRSYRP